MHSTNELRRFAFVLTLILGLALVSCSKPEPLSETQDFLWNQNDEPVLYSKSEDGRVIPEKVARFLNDANRFGEGVKRYRLGSYQKSMTDCSGYIGQAHRSSGYGVVVYQFDYDFLNFTTCSGGLKPGDVVLLAYPGRQPDHWVMMADVKDPQKKFHSEKNVIMDVSTDYVDGKPYFRGELSRRRNLLSRRVYACRRHRVFEREWKALAQQLERQTVAKGESEKSEGEVSPETVLASPAEQLEGTDVETATSAMSQRP